MPVRFTIQQPITLTLDEQQPLEDLVAQLVLYNAELDRLIMVVNGAELRTYLRLVDVPTGGFCLETTTNRFGVTLYHLRSVDNDDLLVCYNACLVERMTKIHDGC